MGCGRVGSTLAHILEDRGYTVAVIDQDPEAFRRLRPSFKGDRVTGGGFDRDVLARAGIERGDGCAERPDTPRSGPPAGTPDKLRGSLRPGSGVEPLWRDATGKLVLTQVTMSPKWIGEPIKLAEMSAGARVAYIDRLGEAVVPQIGTVLQEGDVVHVIARESDLDRVIAAFGTRDGSEH